MLKFTIKKPNKNLKQLHLQLNFEHFKSLEHFGKEETEFEYTVEQYEKYKKEMDINQSFLLNPKSSVFDQNSSPLDLEFMNPCLD